MFFGVLFGQNTVIIQQNIPPQVIEKTVYVERYRTVYIDKPQPKRTARIISAPVQLLGYLWVYTEDLGNFTSQPLSVIASINNNSPYGRNDWRIPTPDELAVMENNADKIGLGDDMYMATNASNGILRLVSTGKTVAEQEEAKRKYEAVLWEEENRKIEAEKKRIAELEKYNVHIGSIEWNATNFGSMDISDIGYQVQGICVTCDKINYVTQFATDFRGIQEYKSELPFGFRLPTKEEAEELIASITNSERAIINGVVVYKYYTKEGDIFAIPCIRDKRGNFMDVRLWLSGRVPNVTWSNYALVFPFVETGCAKPYISYFEDTSVFIGDGGNGDDFDWGFVRCVQKIIK